MNLELLVRCKQCGEVVDRWDLDDADPAVHVCEIADSLSFEHECAPKPLVEIAEQEGR